MRYLLHIDVFILAVLLIASPAAGETINYTFDRAGRISSVQYGEDHLVEYTYDEAGNKVEREAGVPATPTPTPTPTPSEWITVVKPDGGEKIKRGRKRVIKWESGGDIKKVKISLLRQTKKRLKTKIIARKAKNKGRYRWKVPKRIKLCKQCKIRVADRDSSGASDESDDFFKIAR